MIIIKTCGGLGNQLFQYAAALEIAQACHDKVVFDLEFQKKDKRKFELKNLGIREKIVTSNQTKTIIYRLQNFFIKFYKKYIAYSICDNKAIRYFFAIFGVFFCTTNNPDIPKRLLLHKNILLAGSFSNEKYFSNVIVSLRLIMKNFIKKNNLVILEPVVCVHIRRGDYVGNTAYEVCTDEYYYKAMKMIEEKDGKSNFMIFSDDEDYIREHMSFEQSYSICTEKNTCRALAYMTQCSHYVLSNSTFSWWAQKLNSTESKIVIAPMKWYNIDNKCDLYSNSWVKIDL